LAKDANYNCINKKRRLIALRVDVDQELCISCGTCIDTCPEVFEWNEDDKAKSTVDEVPPDLEEQTHEAVDGCPTNAIKED
jgi:ferredoxin